MVSELQERKVCSLIFIGVTLNRSTLASIPRKASPRSTEPIFRNSISYFKQAAKNSGWDWRHLSSVAYQESKFNPNALSFGGAYGMMQFMPNTGPSYGVFPDSDPLTQIMGGAKKLKADEKFWSDGSRSSSTKEILTCFVQCWARTHTRCSTFSKKTRTQSPSFGMIMWNK